MKKRKKQRKIAHSNNAIDRAMLILDEDERVY
jgi:hypothetical protein